MSVFNTISAAQFTQDIRGQIPYSKIASGAEVCCSCTPNRIVYGEKIRYKTPHIIKDQYDDMYEIAFGYIKCPNCGEHITFGLCVNMEE